MNNSASAWEDSVLITVPQRLLVTFPAPARDALSSGLPRSHFIGGKARIGPADLGPAGGGKRRRFRQQKHRLRAKAAGGPRTLPKLGNPIVPAQRTGKLDSGSLDALKPNDAVEATTAPKPMALPGPKVLSTDSGRETVNVKETSPDSLVRLPTKEAATNLPGGVAVDPETSQKSLAALKSTDAGPGIKALKEGEQIPGSLKGVGTGVGPYGVPGGSRSGSGLSGGGSGSGERRRQ